jgi:hypothetical protein
MKKLIMAIGFLFAGILAVNAQDSTQYRRDPLPPDTTAVEQDTTVQDEQDTSSMQYRTEDPARDTTSLSSEGQQDMNQSRDQQDMNQDTTKTAAENQSSSYRSDDQEDDADRKEITVAELPALIQEQLKGQDYTGWLVSNAHKKEKDGQTIYAVELRNGAETKKVKFDAQGNKLKEKDEKDKKDYDR